MKSEMMHTMKFFSVLCCLIVLFLASDAYSQMTYAKKLLSDADTITIPSSDGGYVSFSPKIFGQPYGWVKKTNGLGQRVWENELYFEGDAFELSAMSETIDGGYVSVGGRLGSFGVTIKFAPTGEIQWKKKWISTDDSSFTFLRSVALNNGGFIAAGNGSSSGSPKYIVLAKFNSSGVAQSVSKITLPNVNLELNDFVAAPDGGFFLVSYIPDHKVSIIRLNGRTRILWSRLYEIQNFFDPRIASSPDNGAILTGVDNWGRLVLLRLNINGQVDWKKRHSLGWGIYSHKVNLASDGGYLISGTWSETLGVSMFLLKTDLVGESVFARALTSINSEASTAFSTPDGGFLFSGAVYESCCKYTYFFKLNSHGLVSGCNLLDSVTPTTDDFGEVQITPGQILRSSLSIAEDTLEGTTTPSQSQVLDICNSPLPGRE